MKFNNISDLINLLVPLVPVVTLILGYFFGIHRDKEKDIFNTKLRIYSGILSEISNSSILEKNNKEKFIKLISPARLIAKKETVNELRNLYSIIDKYQEFQEKNLESLEEKERLSSIIESILKENKNREEISKSIIETLKKNILNKAEYFVCEIVRATMEVEQLMRMELNKKRNLTKKEIIDFSKNIFKENSDTQIE